MNEFCNRIGDRAAVLARVEVGVGGGGSNFEVNQAS